MDVITSALSGLTNDLLTFSSLLFHDVLLSFLLLALVLLLLARFKFPKIFPLLIACFLLLVLLDPLKQAFAIPRPCTSLPAKIPCPADAGFPSGHAAIAGIFVLSAVGTAFFYPFLLLGAFISLSRVYLGIHVFSDVVAGIVLGMVLYAISERLYYGYWRPVK
ncbi:PAP2 superfamily protein [Candidatus Burarchaeum australiense]|nr:PAP2 superfamily protein [Candidatus Burarchaeum australiense]